MSNNLVTFEESEVVFVADLFREEYAGGGELSTDALLQTSPFKTHCLKSTDLNQEMLERGAQKTWVFFNFRQKSILIEYANPRFLFFTFQKMRHTEFI